MSVRLAGRLPKGATNGLAHLTDDLRTNPFTGRYVVAYVMPDAIIENLDTEDDPYTVNLRLLAIESPTDPTVLADELARHYRDRTGSLTLPYGDENPDESTLADPLRAAGFTVTVDTDTGEITASKPDEQITVTPAKRAKR